MHALLQQEPSTQNPSAQSAPVVHEAPIGNPLDDELEEVVEPDDDEALDEVEPEVLVELLEPPLPAKSNPPKIAVHDGAAKNTKRRPGRTPEDCFIVVPMGA